MLPQLILWHGYLTPLEHGKPGTQASKCTPWQGLEQHGQYAASQETAQLESFVGDREDQEHAKHLTQSRIRIVSGAQSWCQGSGLCGRGVARAQEMQYIKKWENFQVKTVSASVNTLTQSCQGHRVPGGLCQRL